MARLENYSDALHRLVRALNETEIRYDEVKLLFKRRGRGFQKAKIARLLNTQQRAKLEQLLKETKLKS
jgi:hypothetical protein